ncbi:MAG: hypothetical protein JW801_06430 [Bacteroidales bacterium]|nr:hypothetical protein [Bacteroidales bacterium]
MKKLYFFIPPLAFLLLFSCAEPLNITEIKELQQTTLDPLNLKPSMELFDLRIDIIRQTETTRVDDSTTEQQDVPYHPLGFDLGNGLFYDLNDNLCLRIDYLMDLNNHKTWKLKRNFVRKPRNGTLYSFRNDTLTFEYDGLFRKRKFDKHVERVGDSLSFYYGKRELFSIWEDDSSMYYGNSRRVWDEIKTEFEGSYYVPWGRRRDTYLIVDQEIILDNKYRVLRNEDGTCIEILRIGRRQDYLRFTMIRDGRSIYIYNESFYGMKLELGDQSLKYAWNQSPGIWFERVR